MRKTVILILLLNSLNGFGQTPVLDQYLKTGLEGNKSLKQSVALLEKEKYGLREANSLFLPTVEFTGSYLKSDGGRTIDLPLGDLMNPVYTTLNQLTGTNSFPQIKNESVQLNPDNFYDAKFRVSVPLINNEVWYNRQIKSGILDIQEADHSLNQKIVIQQIKTRYFQVLQAEKAVSILENALNLVKENERVNQSLVKNGLATPSVVTRAKSEVSKMTTSLQEAKNNLVNARSAFNLTIGQSIDSPVLVDSSLYNETLPFPDASSTGYTREEVRKLKAVVDVKSSLNRLNSTFWIPKLSAFADLGSQGEDWKFNNKTRYTMAGLTLSWSLNSGLGDFWKIGQTSADAEAAGWQLADLSEQLDLETDIARKNYRLAIDQYQSRKLENSSAWDYYTDMKKKYQAGSALYIELLDAQNQAVSADLQQAISYYQVLIRLAEVRRLTGLDETL
ncbi:MAG: TolC family protein [Bacteroidetes bacterium]|nr:TolC family protein [Bacteroidota bacterium]